MTIKSNFKFIIDTYSAGEKVQLFQELYKDIAGYGIDGDEELAHINSFEAKVLKSLGGSGTINEITELPQYFGGGGTPTTTTETKADIPDVLKPYVKDILGRAKTRMEEQEEAGYEAYPGERIAEVDPEQEAAQERLLALLGTQEPYLEEALEGYRAAARAPTSEEIQGYMSPYQQAVTDIERRKAGEAYEGVRKAREARMIGGGGMSGLGSRAAIEMGRGEQAHLQSLADIQSKGSQRGWQDAQQRLAEQRTRQRAGAGDVRGIGKDIYGTRVSEIGLGAQVGEQRRQFQQEQLDDLYRRYMEKKQFPEQELAKYSGLVYGMPTGFLANTTATQTGPKGPSFGKQLLGAGLQLGGAFLGGPGGAMAGKALGGMMGAGGGMGLGGMGAGGGGNPANWGQTSFWKSGGLVARQNGGLPDDKDKLKPKSTLPYPTMKPWTGGSGTSKVGLSSLLETIGEHSKEMRDIREKYKTTRRGPFLGPLADFLGATGESIGGNIPVAGPLKERLGAARALTQKQQEQAMALDLKELESQMDVKKELMIQQLKNRSKVGKYSATMLNSMRDTANSLAGTSLIWLDGEWQGTKDKKATPKAMLNFTRILGLLENRTAKYLEAGYDELEAVGAAKADLQDKGVVTQSPAAMGAKSNRPPPILPTVPAPASVSPIKILEGN
tara:strand:- start:2058 stop:4064 length:2007 start_codon:yes stop_codon:yes gene_type:complete